MTTSNSYFHFDGKAEEAFNFYKTVFGGEFVVFQRLSDGPDGDKLPPGEQQLIMHATLKVNEQFTLMGSDVPPSMGFKVTVGNHSYVNLVFDSREETTRVYKALTEGGQVMMPLADMFWGAYFGMCTDKFGNQWMVNYSADKHNTE